MAKDKGERIFAEDIQINKYKLEEECERHSGMYFYWAQKLADAKSELNRAEDKLKLTNADRELFLRSHWNDDKYGKMTEGGVKAVLECDSKVIEQKATVNKAQEEVNSLNAAVSALEHRKSELDNLVTLLVKGFYSAPNGGKREGVNESASRELRGNLNEGRRK
jgi:hypothetical protein